MSAVLCTAVRGFEEVGFYVLKVLAVWRYSVSAFLAYICGRSSNITIVREAVCRSCGRCGSNICADGAFVRGMFAGKSGVYPYLIVLGAQVDGRRITDSLKRRLDRAEMYLKEHVETVVIVSGGRGDQEEIPEAEAMEKYLLEKGIEGKRILKENRSRTTKENLIFSKVYIEDMDCPVGIVSNSFHLYRAVCYARKTGYIKPCPLAADCHPLLLPNYMVREFFAVWKMWLTYTWKSN